MTINISIDSLVSEIRQKSHFETQYIQDAKQRDNVRAGLEKSDEVLRCAAVSDAQLRAIVDRYLLSDLQATTTAGIAVGDLSYNFKFSERREPNKAVQLPQLMRGYLVAAALSKYYATVSASDLAAKRGNEAAALAADILRLIYTKTPPVL